MVISPDPLLEGSRSSTQRGRWTSRTPCSLAATLISPAQTVTHPSASASVRDCLSIVITMACISLSPVSDSVLYLWRRAMLDLRAQVVERVIRQYALLPPCHARLSQAPQLLCRLILREVAGVSCQRHVEWLRRGPGLM